MSGLQRVGSGASRTLDDLAARINAEHRACEAAAVSAVEHAVRAGEMLAEVKSGLKHGEWLPWLEANFEGTGRTAQVYMQLYSRRDELSNTQRVSHLSIRSALKELAEPRLSPNVSTPREPESTPFASTYYPDGEGGWRVEHYYSMQEYAEARGYRVSPPLLVDPEFNGKLPPLSDVEYAGLERSILEDGCRDVIVAWNNTILDGHARYEICVKHGIDYLVADREMESREEAILYIIDTQRGRKNLSLTDRVDLAGKMEVQRLVMERGISEEQAWEEILREA